MTPSEINWTVHQSPVGPLTLIAGPAGLIGVRFRDDAPAPPTAARRPEALDAVARQLDEYFAGERQEFDVALDVRGTDFQRAVWSELRRIPYGTTTSYGAIADAIGRPDRVRV